VSPELQIIIAVLGPVGGAAGAAATIWYFIGKLEGKLDTHMTACDQRHNDHTTACDKRLENYDERIIYLERLPRRP
jgi:hypothetical protein